MTKISGAELKPGDVIKHNNGAHGGRIYEVVEIEESDRVGARYGSFRQSNGEIVCFNVFTDSEYEVRDSMPGQRKRMVKVDRTSLAGALYWLGLTLPGLSCQETADRIIERI
jgi:hypothetical protein